MQLRQSVTSWDQKGDGSVNVRFRPGVLRVTAAVFWGATVIGMFTGFDNHRAWTELDTRIWLCVLGGALLSSWAAVQHYLIDRASRAASAMTRAALTRPFDRDTGPLARITGPMARLSQLPGPGDGHAARRGPGAHAASRR